MIINHRLPVILELTKNKYICNKFLMFTRVLDVVNEIIFTGFMAFVFTTFMVPSFMFETSKMKNKRDKIRNRKTESVVLYIYQSISNICVCVHWRSTSPKYWTMLVIFFAVRSVIKSAPSRTAIAVVSEIDKHSNITIIEIQLGMQGNFLNILIQKSLYSILTLLT